MVVNAHLGEVTGSFLKLVPVDPRPAMELLKTATHE